MGFGVRFAWYVVTGGLELLWFKVNGWLDRTSVKAEKM